MRPRHLSAVTPPQRRLRRHGDEPVFADHYSREWLTILWNAP